MGALQLEMFPEPSPWTLHVWPSGRAEVRRWLWDDGDWISHVGAWGENVDEARAMAARRGLEVQS